MNPSPYNLITPVKDEEEHLPKLAHCVISQSHRPDVWVIIDDGSTDTTPQIIGELTARHTWIHGIRIDEEEERTFGSHLFRVFRLGLERSLELSGGVDYLINLDADVRFHDDTFKILCEAMDQQDTLAIASPRLMTLRQEIDVEGLKRPETTLADKELVIRTDRSRVNEPTNGIRIYRRSFIDEIGGFPVNDAADDIILGKAVVRGYRVSFIDGVWGYLTRETGTTLRSDYIRGKVKGYRLYIAHYHPVLAAASLIWDVIFRRSWAAGVLVGYLESLFKRKERIDDPDVIRYYGRERFRTVMEFIRGSLPGRRALRSPDEGQQKKKTSDDRLD